jgi:hypothetical protein
MFLACCLARCLLVTCLLPLFTIRIVYFIVVVDSIFAWRDFVNISQSDPPRRCECGTGFAAVFSLSFLHGLSSCSSKVTQTAENGYTNLSHKNKPSEEGSSPSESYSSDLFCHRSCKYPINSVTDPNRTSSHILYNFWQCLLGVEIFYKCVHLDFA